MVPMLLLYQDSFSRKFTTVPTMIMAGPLKLAVLRKHEVAGQLICSIEDWFHKPTGAEGVDVTALLEPYRNIYDEEESPA